MKFRSWGNDTFSLYGDDEGEAGADDLDFSVSKTGIEIDGATYWKDIDNYNVGRGPTFSLNWEEASEFFAAMESLRERAEAMRKEVQDEQQP